MFLRLESYAQICLSPKSQINEVFEYASRGKQINDEEKKRRAVFIQRALEAEEDVNRRKIVVKEILTELTTLNDGNDRGQ